jgi:hypothetical protein
LFSKQLFIEIQEQARFVTISVYIHIGPPKTATSAIQNWLQNNRDLLLRHSIFYPEHNIDENGVSSGNVLDVFDRKEDTKLIISDVKIKQLLQDCENNKCDTLLLSSEFFFFQVSELLKVFPQAKLIVYLRFPLDVIESSYNQAVKRHNETKPFGLPKEPNAYHLKFIDKMFVKHGMERFIVRFYERTMFVNGDIISDFNSILGLKHDQPEPNIINSSYTFEALELKRWLNTFLPSDYQQRVDRFLQSYNLGADSYSLIKPKQHRQYVEWFIAKLESFFELYPIKGNQQYLSAIKATEHKCFIPQTLSIEEFKRIVGAMVHWDERLVYGLAKKAAMSEEAKHKRADFVDGLSAAVSRKYQFRSWLRETRLSIIFVLKRGIRRFRSPSLDHTESAVTSIERMRSILKIEAKISDAVIYRELALYCEQNDELGLAYNLMKEADALRPNGPVITAKLAEYQEKLNFPVDPRSSRK